MDKVSFNKNPNFVKKQQHPKLEFEGVFGDFISEVNKLYLSDHETNLSDKVLFNHWVVQ